MVIKKCQIISLLSFGGDHLAFPAIVIEEHEATHCYFCTPTVIETIYLKMAEHIANHQKRDYTHIIRA